MKLRKKENKSSWFKKIFIKICRFFDYEIIDQGNLYLPVSKKYIDEDLSKIGKNSIIELMKAVDENIPQPDRPKDQPFLMPVEDVFSISGRVTVVTGRIEQGVLKVGEEKMRLKIFHLCQ